MHTQRGYTRSSLHKSVNTSDIAKASQPHQEGKQASKEVEVGNAGRNLPVPKTMTSYSLAISSMAGKFWGILFCLAIKLVRKRWYQEKQKMGEKVVDSRSQRKREFSKWQKSIGEGGLSCGGYKRHLVFLVLKLEINGTEPQRA